MLGRLHADLLHPGGEAAAIAWYRKVRALAEAGFADDLGLAVASLGEEARLELRAGHDAAGYRRYAEQAAAGDPGGGTSLLELVRGAVRRGDERRLLGFPVGQRLVALYLFDRNGELDDGQRDRLWAELAALDQPAGAGALAAAAYRAGRWDLARRLAGHDPDGPRARRVLAKLALRDGDEATADRLLAGLTPTARISAERAAIALHQDRPVDAMRLLWRFGADDPEDTAYVAERVLSIDELRAFVDALPARPPPDSEDADDWGGLSAADLRELLARRLMRAGDYADALPYFTPGHRVVAAGFGLAMTRARHDDDPIVRARAAYVASRLARRDGLEILGTAVAPDWGLYGADFDLSAYREPHEPSRWLGGDEAFRLEDSAPAHPERYQYRFVASELAEWAADDLPHRSQAFAMTLCWSARDVFNRDPRRVQTLWRRYVHEGPWVAFEFGQDCPEPAFDGARRYLTPRAGPAPARSPGWSRHRRAPVAAAAGLAALVALVLLVRLRRRRRPPPVAV